MGSSAPASLICASMSLACASLRLTSLLALAGGLRPLRRLASTGDGSAAQPLGLLGPLRDLARADRLVVQAQGLLPGPVGVDELGKQPARQLGAHPALAKPDAQVDLLGPEVLGPDVPVHPVQVVQ